MDGLLNSPWFWALIWGSMGGGLFALVQYLPRWLKPPASPDDPDHLLEALIALAADDRDRAASHLGQAIETHPEEPRSFLFYGVLLLQRGEVKRSCRVLEGLLARRDLAEGIAFQAAEVLVVALVRCGRLEAARHWLSRLAGQFRGRGLERGVRLAAAARDYALARQLVAAVEHQDKAAGRRGRALLLAAEAEQRADEENPAEAMKLARKATTTDSACAVGWALLGQLLLEEGKLERARQAFREGLLLDPLMGVAIYPTLEDAHLADGRVADYEQMLQEILIRNPAEPVALWALGMHLTRRHHDEQGVAYLRAALDAAPEFVRARRMLAEAVGEPIPAPARNDPGCTYCGACGTAGVHGIVRCPVCGQIGQIAFRLNPGGGGEVHRD